MRKTILGLAACAAVSAFGTGSASAFPAAPLGRVASPVEQVRLVCNEWGRCWRTGPRYGYYGPRYGYYGPVTAIMGGRVKGYITVGPASRLAARASVSASDSEHRS